MLIEYFKLFVSLLTIIIIFVCVSYVCLRVMLWVGKCSSKYCSGLGLGFKLLCLNPLGKVGCRPRLLPQPIWWGIVLHGGSRAGAAACSTYLGRACTSSVAIPSLKVAIVRVISRW